MASLRVEVVYALADRQEREIVELAPGATAADALAASGMRERHPETGRFALGVFGRIVRADHRLEDGDRLEIYRPLIADPKDARRRRADKKR